MVTWPEPSEESEPPSLDWKTRTLVDWAAGRPFAWPDNEITDTDRTWAEAHCPARTFLHRIDHRHGLTDADFAALDAWLQAPRPPPSPSPMPGTCATGYENCGSALATTATPSV